MATSWNRDGAGAVRVASSGHAVFAATMISIGILGFIRGDFTPTWTGVPKELPAREVLAYLCAFVSLETGMSLLCRRATIVASGVLVTYLLIWLLLFRMPHVVSAPTASVTWWACGDTAVMAAGAWVLYACFASTRDGPRLRFATGERGVRVARVLYALAMIPFGVAHFTYLKETVALPVWVPMVVAGPNAFQWNEFIDSWALTAGAWVVAESYRGMPWLAVGAR